VNFQYVTKGVIANNIIDGVDDDCIAVGYNGTGNASNIVVTGNFCRARADLGTTTGRGILIANCSDVLVADNVFDTIKQTGIQIIQEAAGARPTRISVKNNKVRNVATSSGHGIAVYGSSYTTLEGNDVTDQANGSGIEIADWQYLSIKGGTLSQSVNVFGRGIHADESAGWGTTTWTNLDISNVTIRMVGASTNSCIYLSPDAANTMATVTITGVVGSQVVAGDYITVNSARTSTLGKIVNNTTMTSGRTVSPATGGVFTTTNNN
jgi:parallel beta-helix repeat protein